MSLKHILKGFGNLFLDELNLLPENKKAEAIEIVKECLTCPLYKKGRCNSKGTASAVRDFYYGARKIKKGDMVEGCGCMIRAKALSSDKCPRGVFENHKVIVSLKNKK